MLGVEISIDDYRRIGGLLEISVKTYFFAVSGDYSSSHPSAIDGKNSSSGVVFVGGRFSLWTDSFVVIRYADRGQHPLEYDSNGWVCFGR